MTDRGRLRAELVDLTRALLLGPLDNDEMLDAPPSDTYLTGILWPRGSEIGAEEDDDAVAGPDDHESGADAAVPGYRAVRPCSIGLTFSADLGSDLHVDLGSTARYREAEGPPPVPLGGNTSETYVPVDPTGLQGGLADSVEDKIRHWVRVPLMYSLEVPFAPENRTWSTTHWQKSDGVACIDDTVTLHIRRRILDDQQVLTITLINSAPEPSQGSPRDANSLFQAQLVVEAISPGHDRACIRPRPVPAPAGGDEDAETSALLHRSVREYAVGHGIAAISDEAVDDAVKTVRTEWLPSVSVKGTSANGHRTLQSFLGKEPEALSASWLSRSEAREEIIAELRKFAACYGAWIDTELEQTLQDIPEGLQVPAKRNLKRCYDALERMVAGIDVLEEGGEAWESFVLANGAMDRQSRFGSKEPKAGPLNWRPFQLAYLLVVLPGLVDPERFPDDRRRMDLLWFPTGGGKTEAYLGLTAFVIFFRRLSDPLHAKRGGVDVLMRYTLRLLTVQQFQRAASLICACEFVRRERGDLGEAQVSIGLYVGGDATPNRMADAVTAIAEEHRGLAPRTTPRQLLACPVCGTPLPPTAYALTVDESTVEIRCHDTDCETAGLPLPVLTVDDNIYAAPPSLLIGTIDKFAQLPRREDLRRLFGLDGGRRPELIVQDELHLISGPLGSIAGLYETAIDLLCTYNGTPPKIIGSTATIGQAARQVRALFDREVSQFPPPGFDAADSFFAVRDETGPDRLYLGVCSAGRSPKFALQAAAASVLEGVQALRSQDDVTEELIDAFWTCVLYFNSIRELGGAYSLMQDDVPRQIAFLASRLALPPRVLEQNPVELSSRINSRDLPSTLMDLDTRLDGGDDPYAAAPKDSVLASNMISVGVDISRLGLMLVNGQPKSTAEYIQATSRVGRGIEGLVITVYNFGRPRDLSHFEHFAGYHSALYRSVEATSVTPWAPRARDKALHAMFASVVRHLVAGMSPDDAAVHFDPNDPEVGKVVEFILERAASASHSIEQHETREDLEAIIEQWARRTREGGTNGKLRYWEKKAPFGKTAPFLMYAAEEGARNSVLSWPTPNSMREVEPSTAFTLKRIGRNS